nr:hypothetical protein [uncultured Anaerobutyricum sp.]
MRICILNTLRSRIWDMVLFLFSVYTKSIFDIIAAIMQTEDCQLPTT